MLIVQVLDTYYYKQARASEYARLRNSDLFRKIDHIKVKECEVFVQSLSLRYDPEGNVSHAKPYLEVYKEYGKNIFTEGSRDRFKNYNDLIKFIRIFREEEKYKIMFCDENVEWCPTKRQGHNEAYNDPESIFYHRNTLNETAFILEKGEYGRIIFNNRYVDPDSQHWHYGWHVYNLINCDISECKDKMFFEKNPDHEYKQLIDLR